MLPSQSIRNDAYGRSQHQTHVPMRQSCRLSHQTTPKGTDLHLHCLLYTSDAADEEDSVDLGGRRIIKKKKKKKKRETAGSKRNKAKEDNTKTQ